YVTILRHADRLAPVDKPSFYAEARASARRHGQDWSSVPRQNAASNLRAHLFLDRSYRAFTLYNRVDAARRSLRRTAGRVYWPARRAVRRLRAVGRIYYPFARMRPIDPNLVVFSDYWGTGFGCNPRALFERLADVAPSLKAVWIISPEKAAYLPPGTRHVSPDSWRRYAIFARATYFVNNVNFPGPVVKRPGQVHIQTMHGTPLKHCGLDVMRSSVAGTAVDPVRQPKRSEGRVVASDEAQSLREFENLLRRSDRWDVALSSNAYSTEMWSHAYPCRYQWLEFGYPRNDALVNATLDDVAAARELLGVPQGATAILYAPTFREAVGDTSMRIDIGALLEHLPSDTVFIVRAHHTATEGRAMRALMESGRVIDGSKVPWIVPCYLAADVLLTDYSSVMFDYALLNRPTVIYADDWFTYLETRGAYFDLLAAPPGLVARNPRRLAEVLAGREYDGDESARLRAAFRARFCTYDGGLAAERIIRSVMLPD
ncbi:MAG: CDP-glycerol glycerophosphotransferase family protein, partial [Actinobacteria bacterium]|nr:CDP-glycerol glycerophosphotransferase family protein [Actinomycetota bacterium]